MKILFNDVIQYSSAPKELKSPALSDVCEINGNLVINLDRVYEINSIGVGNINNNKIIFDGGKADSVYNLMLYGGNADSYSEPLNDISIITISFNDVNNTIFNLVNAGNGLYTMKKTIKASQITIEANANFIGRFAAGIACNIPTAVMKEPSYLSTSEPRVTLSGQVIQGAGGYNYRAVSLDSRYKITKEIINEFEKGLKYTGMGYPYFIDLTDESYKLPFKKLYANEKNQRSMTFQSGVTRFLYSRRFEFEERF